MILVDSSAWIEYDRGTGSPIHRRLAQLVAETDEVAVTEPVVMELLVGVRSDEHEVELRRLLGRFTLLRFDAAIDFDGATAIYRRCRWAGVTPRGAVDCMIAAVALRHRAQLLSADTDLHRMAEVIGLPLASLEG